MARIVEESTDSPPEETGDIEVKMDFNQTQITMSKEFAIYDALLWEPPKGYFLLDYHLRRLEHSAAYFRFPLDVTTTRKKLLDYAQQLPTQPRKVRLNLAANGVIVMRDENVKPSIPVAVALSEEAVHSGDKFLSKAGNPPALPGDLKSLTVPG